MAIIGTSVHVLTYHWPAIVMKRIAIIATVSYFIFVPSYYIMYPSPRPMREAYEELKNYTVDINKNGKNIVLGDYLFPLMRYTIITDRQEAKGWDSSKKPSVFDYDILDAWKHTESLSDFLEANDVNFFFIQPRIYAVLRNAPGARDLLEHPETVGWQILRPSDNQDPGMFLLRKNDNKS